MQARVGLGGARSGLRAAGLAIALGLAACRGPQAERVIEYQSQVWLDLRAQRDPSTSLALRNAGPGSVRLLILLEDGSEYPFEIPAGAVENLVPAKLGVLRVQHLGAGPARIGLTSAGFDVKKLDVQVD